MMVARVEVDQESRTPNEDCSGKVRPMMVVQEVIDLVGSNTPGTRYVGREARPAGSVGAKMAQR